MCVGEGCARDKRNSSMWGGRGVQETRGTVVCGGRCVQETRGTVVCVGGGVCKRQEEQ